MNFFLALILIINFSFSADKVFVACEGNFYEGNGSLWTISGNEVIENNNQENWNVLQSVYVFEDMLFVISNGANIIHVFNITDSDIEPIAEINTYGSGPREMIVHDGSLYFTNWYSADVKKVNLGTWSIESEISMPGLPEDIVKKDGVLYISIIMNHDWTDGNQVVALDPASNTIIEYYDVGAGPSELLVFENDVYISRTYYDADWNAFYGTSRISDSGVDVIDYGFGAVCGGGILKFQDSVYRVYDGGIAQLDSDLEILPETRIGSYDSEEIYSAAVVDDNIYFGLSDFTNPDFVAVVNSQGEEISRYQVGVFPGDFAVWSSCSANADVNLDGEMNVGDIIDVVSSIVNDSEYSCSADLNYDQVVDILDVIMLVQEILGIESFNGAVNWLNHHFPELRAFSKLKEISNQASK